MNLQRTDEAADILNSVFLFTYKIIRHSIILIYFVFLSTSFLCRLVIPKNPSGCLKVSVVPKPIYSVFPI